MQPTPEQTLKQCEEVLRAAPTDWDALYLRVRSSALGADFPKDRFLRTPISALRRVFRYLDDQEKAEANLQALPTARLCQIVIQLAHGLSGSKRAGPKVTAKDFLPYPEWKPPSADASGPDQPTKFILSELGRNRQLPPHVLAALMTPAEQRP